MSNGNSDPADRAIGRMSHRKLRRKATQGNKLAQKIVKALEKKSGRRAAKAIRRAKKGKQ